MYREPLSILLKALWEMTYMVKTILKMLEDRVIHKTDDLASLIWFFRHLALEHSDVRED